MLRSSMAGNVMPPPGEPAADALLILGDRTGAVAAGLDRVTKVPAWASVWCNTMADGKVCRNGKIIWIMGISHDISLSLSPHRNHISGMLSRQHYDFMAGL